MPGMPRRALLLLVLLACALPLHTAWAEDAKPKDEAEARISMALALLESPIASERRRGVDRLSALMPGAGPAVLAALESSSWSVQAQLLEVLGRDGSETSIRALLRHLVRADEAQAVRIRLAVVQDVEASARLLADWRKAPQAFVKRGGGGADGTRRLQELVDLLRRAEIEAKFLSRKSKSGSTGYYKGQYDLLKGEGLEPGYRKLALEVVAGIAVDRAIPTPGLYRQGIYRFLRPHFVDEWEFQSMALNAVAELCTPEDRAVIERLEGRRLTLLIKKERLKEQFLEARSFYPYDSKEYQDAWFDWDDALGEYLDQIATLYIVAPDRYHHTVKAFIDELLGRPRPVRPYSYVAGLQIRCGWYEDAIDSYDDAMRWGSKAYGYYNQACAYASWSRKEGLAASERDRKLDRAMLALSRSVSYGWSDIDWMNEDRDLDPLRAHRKTQYDALIQLIKQKYGLEDE